MNKHNNIDYITIPNLITLLRILLIPFFILLAYYSLVADFPSIYPATLSAFFIFLAIRATDIIDGWVARLTNSISVLGSYLDVWADFLFVLCSYMMLNFMDFVPTWLTLLAVYKFFEFLILSEIINRHRANNNIENDSVIHYDIPGRVVSALFYTFPVVILFFRLLCIESYALKIMCYGILAFTIVSSILKITSIKKTITRKTAEASGKSF